MRVLFENGKVLIELNRDIGEIDEILEYIRIKEIRAKSNKISQKEIDKLAKEINKSYYENYLKAIIENSN